MYLKTTSAACAALFLCAGSTLARPTQVPPSDPGVAEAEAKPVDAESLRWGGPGEGEVDPVGHPPIDEIPPMPMPTDDGFEGAGGPGLPVSHDSSTGETTVYPVYPSARAPGGEGPGFTAPFGDLTDERYGPRGFNNLDEINNVDNDPWRRNVKVVLRFVDSGGNDRFFVCSGTMADPETVLLAGHCVYAHTPNGITINDWASEIWVYPGWDGVGNQFSEPDGIIETHGVAHGTSFGAFTGWTQDENLDWDMGLARVNRAAGQLTGWFGWAWGFGCGTIQGRTYNNATYPSEGCPTPGLHTGRDMYYWFGSIDSCTSGGRDMRIDTSPGCFTAQHGGMSGGGVYYFDSNDNRLVHAVNSHSATDDSYADFTKMWEDFRNFMLDFEDDSRGSSLDLQMLRVRYVEDEIDAGMALGGDDYFVANPTNADPADDTYTVTHYLSTNPNISTADTELRTESFGFDFAPVQGVNVNNSGTGYTIPIDTPTGTYYAGAILEDSDANNVNNDGDDWDAHEVRVNAVADIAAESVDAPSATQFVGETMDVGFELRNRGAAGSDTIFVEVRASSNQTITVSDPLLDSFSYAGLPGTTPFSTTETVSIPGSLGTGDFYVGIIVTAADDVDDDNDTAVDTGRVTFASRPPNNVCSEAIDVTDGEFNFSNVYATTDGPADAACDKFGDDQVRSDVWYEYTATCDGEATVSLCGSGFDTKMAVYEWPCPDALNTAIACNDDSCGLQSEVTFEVADGKDYLIRIGGFNGEQGEGVALITCTPDCLADINGDGKLDLSDTVAFVQAFQSGDPIADFNGDGKLDLSDTVAFVQAFTAGCPG